MIHHRSDFSRISSACHGRLALTARGGKFGDGNPVRGLSPHTEAATIARVDGACSTAIRGRRAARVVAEWAKRLELTEAEFQLLWRLRTAPGAGLDQTALAGELAFSPAQISASVERLRIQELVCATGSATDRRRRHWRLSGLGHALVGQMLVAETPRHDQAGNERSIEELNGDGGRETAA